MKRFTQTMGLLITAILLSGCEDPFANAPLEPSGDPPDSTGGGGAPDAEAVSRKVLDLLDESANLLASIHDEDSARAAARKMVSVEARKRKTQQELEQLKRTLSAEENKRLAEQYGGELMARTQRVVQEHQRLQAMPGAWKAYQEEAQSLLGGAPSPPGPRVRGHAPPPRGRGSRGRRPQNIAEVGQWMDQQYGADKVVRVVIENVRGEVGEFIRERFSEIANPTGYSGAGSRGGDTMWVAFAPVADVQRVASQIDFGTVTDVDLQRRLITVRADPAKLPKPLGKEIRNANHPDFYKQNLADLKSLNKGRSGRALQRLAKVKPAQLRQEIAAAIETYLLDKDSHRRQEALGALAVWSTKDIVPVMVDALRDEDGSVRQRALEILAQKDDPRSHQAVAALLVTDRHQASTYLKKIGTPAQKTVAEYFEHREADVRRAALEVAKAIATNEIVPELIEVLSDGEEDIRYRALDLLEKLGDKRSFAPIARLLLSDRDRPKASACLRKMGPAVEDTVVKGLKHGNPEVVRECCNILAEVGTKKSLQDLRRLASSRNPLVRSAATKAGRAIVSRQSPK